MTNTNDSRWSAFSAADIERRWTRARAEMAEQGLDALLVSGEENFQYFTGSTGTLAYHYSCTRPAVLVFPREGEPAAVAGEMLTHSLAMTTRTCATRGATSPSNAFHTRWWSTRSGTWSAREQGSEPSSGTNSAWACR